MIDNYTSYQITNIIKKAKQGDEKAITEVINHYEHKIQVIANYCIKNYYLGIIERDDLLQAGRLGIYKQLKKKVFKTNHIGWYILTEMQDEIFNHSSIIRLPANYYDQSYREKNTQIPIYEYLKATQVTYDINDYKLLCYYDFEDYIHSSLTIDKINKILTDKEKEVLSLIYNSEYTYEEIGQILGISKQRAHEIHKKIKDKIQDRSTLLNELSGRQAI